MTTCTENTKTETCPAPMRTTDGLRYSSGRGWCETEDGKIVPASGYPLAFWTEEL